MPLIETLTVNVAASVGKAVLKAWLKDPWLVGATEGVIETLKKRTDNSLLLVVTNPKWRGIPYESRPTLTSRQYPYYDHPGNFLMQLTETDIAIITPTGIEWLGMLGQMPDAVPVDDVPLPMKIGTIGTHTVLCCACGKGQEEAASAATLVMERTKPAWILLVGMAGGVPEARGFPGRRSRRAYNS